MGSVPARWLAALATVAAGCAAVSSSERPGIRPEDVEVVSVKDQALQEIEQAPLDFDMPYAADLPAWQRAISFFKMYLKEQGRAPFSETETVIENQAGEGVRYVYRVVRTPAAGAMHYRVSCGPAGPGSTPLQADTNARNLARFIRDGTLELSWLYR